MIAVTCFMAITVSSVRSFMIQASPFRWACRWKMTEATHLHEYDTNTRKLMEVATLASKSAPWNIPDARKTLPLEQLVPYFLFKFLCHNQHMIVSKMSCLKARKYVECSCQH